MDNQLLFPEQLQKVLKHDFMSAAQKHKIYFNSAIFWDYWLISQKYSKTINTNVSLLTGWHVIKILHNESLQLPRTRHFFLFWRKMYNLSKYQWAILYCILYSEHSLIINKCTNSLETRRWMSLTEKGNSGKGNLFQGLKWQATDYTVHFILFMRQTLVNDEENTLSGHEGLLKKPRYAEC